MQVTIVGVKKSEYTGKDNKPKVGYNYSGTKSFTRYEQENSVCVGSDVIREFSSIDFGVIPGDIVEFVYEPGYQDKAILVDIKVLTPAEQPPFDDKKDKSSGKDSGK